MKLAIGLITYNNFSAKYLPYFMKSLASQDCQDFELLVGDNSEKSENQNKNFFSNCKFSFFSLKNNFFWNEHNFGFGKAYNELLKKAVDHGAEYFLIINPDVKLKKDAIRIMISCLENNKNLASVSPKILKWDFENQEKGKAAMNDDSIIDSCGMRLLPGLRFVDIGQGEIDFGQFDEVDILGPSGACGMFRLSFLENIKDDDQYFDELMFMYKEDCDLNYRLFLKGYKSKLLPNAIAYHDRTVSGKGESGLQIFKNRKNKSKQARVWSMINQQIIYWKYWRVINWKDKIFLIWNQCQFLFNMIFFEQFLFLHLWEMRKKCSQAKIFG